MSDKNYLGYNVERLETAPAFLPYSKVIAWYDDENAFVAGDDSGRVLTVDLPFATQAIVDKMLERIKGYSYQPWTGSEAILDPAAELGDGVTVNGVYSVLASAETSFDALMVSDAAAPADEEVDHEYPHVPAVDRALRRKVTLGADYFGSRITRKSGLQVVKHDADGSEIKRATFNADVLEMCDEDGTPCVENPLCLAPIRASTRSVAWVFATSLAAFSTAFFSAVVSAPNRLSSTCSQYRRLYSV